ncbi:hypothetical protein APHAL10511_001011 [Amanita phalloides]|nr:hypothetical protein APHAL10511_001011 [Amanita phalloides]
MKFTSLLCALLSVISVSAKVFNVAVGANNQLVYDPPSISGAVAGDQILFTFTSKNHTVTQSTFNNPCVKASSTAIDSGFKPVAGASQPTFSFNLNAHSASAPLWFYCAQTNPANHCHAGMVFAVNPTATKTFAQFQANAKASPSLPGTSSANTGTVHVVLVGQNSTLTFNPPSIRAVAGDTIAFTFMSKNHSATQSTFTNPCTLAPGGVNSGFQAIPPNSTTAAQWSITLDAASAASPLWFFCAQTVPAVHCHTGMVFAINPTTTKTFAQFKSNAMNAGSPTSSGTATSASASSSSTVGSPSSTETDSDSGSDTDTDSDSGSATSAGGAGSATVTSASSKSTSTNGAPGLRSSINVGLVVSVLGLALSLGF